MTGLILDGCRATPLGGYLASLGLLRAVSRLVDSDATGWWERGRFVLDCRCATVDELVAELGARFEPEAIVSPWSEGAGLVAKGSNRTAADAVDSVRRSSDPRLGSLRAAVRAGDRVIAIGLERGWGGQGSDLWDKTRKRDVLALCRREFPDVALAWLDAAATLGQDDNPAYSRLLGTGGNFGRQDLSATYLARVDTVFRDGRSPDWLRSLVTGDESVPYLRDTVGQFDPGRAGGIQSSPWEKADDSGFVNPWAFVLTLEGTLLFASAVVRRHGADHSRVALPFQVNGSTAGYGSAAPGEIPLGELWAPEWTSPARLDEVTHLLAEGRAEWRSGPARSGLDFARAVATLGVDRGITAFGRHVFVDRLGQNPLAVPAGRIEVRRRGGVELLGGVDAWIDRLRHAVLPGGVEARVRAVEQALFAHARDGGAAALAEVFAALGRCHEVIARSGSVRDKVHPLTLRGGVALLRELLPAMQTDRELRLAMALASARDDRGVPTLDGVRPCVSAVTADPLRDRVPRWSPGPAPVSLTAGVSSA
ncbi:MAG: type I-G CRISPR-associated protein Cas8g1/Csx17, partial [Sciscionella sp.]